MLVLWLAMYRPEHKPNYLRFAIEQQIHNIVVIMRETLSSILLLCDITGVCTIK